MKLAIDKTLAFLDAVALSPFGAVGNTALLLAGNGIFGDGGNRNEHHDETRNDIAHINILYFPFDGLLDLQHRIWHYELCFRYTRRALLFARASIG